MSLFRTMLMVFICLSLSLWLGGFTTPASSLITGNSNFFNATKLAFSTSLADTNVTDTSFDAVKIGAISIVVIGAMVLTSGTFSLPILLAVIAAIFVLNMFTTPLGLGNIGMPEEFWLMYQGLNFVLQFLFLIGLIDWLRGDLN